MSDGGESVGPVFHYIGTNVDVDLNKGFHMFFDLGHGQMGVK